MREIGLWQASLEPPKYLVEYSKSRCSSRQNTLVCPDKNCGFNISIQYRYITNNRPNVSSWKIGAQPGFVEQLYHNDSCTVIANLLDGEIVKENGVTGVLLVGNSSETSKESVTSSANVVVQNIKSDAVKEAIVVGSQKTIRKRKSKPQKNGDTHESTIPIAVDGDSANEAVHASDSLTTKVPRKRKSMKSKGDIHVDPPTKVESIGVEEPAANQNVDSKGSDQPTDAANNALQGRGDSIAATVAVTSDSTDDPDILKGEALLIGLKQPSNSAAPSIDIAASSAAEIDSNGNILLLAMDQILDQMAETSAATTEEAENHEAADTAREALPSAENRVSFFPDTTHKDSILHEQNGAEGLPTDHTAVKNSQLPAKKRFRAETFEISSNSISECGLCRSRFKQKGSLVPHQLICGHSYCHKDISELIKKEGDTFSCPGCSRLQNLQYFTNRFPPRNESILQYLKRGSTIAGSSFSCSNCEQKAATSYCAQCDAEICDSCDQSIHAMKILSNHVRGPVDSKPTKYTSCEAHKEPLKWLCSWAVPVCSQCSSNGLHDEHERRLIEDVIEAEQQSIKRKLSIQEEQLKALSQYSENLSSEEKELSQVEEQAILEVRARIKAVTEALFSKEKELIQRVQHSVSERQKAIIDRLLAIAANLAATRTASHEATLALTIRDAQLLDKLRDAHNHLDEVIERTSALLGANNTVLNGGRLDYDFSGIDISRAVTDMELAIKLSD